MNKHYYEHMTKVKQMAYHQMYEGLTAIAPSFQVIKLPIEELSEIFFQLRLDHPMIFYVETFSCRMVQGADSVMMHPVYMFEKKKIKEHQKTLEARITRLLRPTEGMKEIEKERYIHDFICENVRYDKLKKSYSHEIIGPLQQGIGVCEGIAKTVKLFCDRMNIECMIPICGADPENGSKYRHAWNILKIGGKYYHLDATFDNSLGKYGTTRYDYFNLDDKKVFRDHRPLIYPAPSCADGEVFYYKENKLSFTKIEDVGKRVQQAIRKKLKFYTFHWRGGYLTKEVMIELMQTIKEAAEAKNKYVQLSVNYSQAVIQLAFSDERPNVEVETEVAEEADEEDETEVIVQSTNGI